MTAYRIIGRDSGVPSLPDAVLAGSGFGDIVNLTLDPAVEAVLIDAGLIELVVTGVVVQSIVVTQAAYDALTPDANTLYVIVG